MKKIIAVSIFAMISIFPVPAHAAINSLNGLTDALQSLVTPGSNAANSMHMEIVQVGTDKHRFRWDGSPWRPNQGGTGLVTNPSFGQILMGNNSGGFDLVATSSLQCSVPGGTNGQLQFNNEGTFGGAKLTYTEDTNGHAIVSSENFLRLESIPGIVVGNFNFVDGQLGNITVDPGTVQIKVENAETFSAIDVVPEQILLTSKNVITLQTNNSVRFVPETGFGTTTVDFGIIDSQDSHTCFNVQNTDGEGISLYFVGTTMVAEAEPCK